MAVKGKEKTPAQKRKLEEARRLMAEEGFVLKGKSEDRAEASRESDATALFISNHKDFTRKTCQRCQKHFATSYTAVAFCSDVCRKLHWKDIGLYWDPNKPPEQRWVGGPVPLVVGPYALEAIGAT